MRPVIGITSFNDTTKPWIYTTVNVNYPYSVAKGGGLPLLVPGLAELDIDENDTARIAAQADDYIAHMDGLLLSGGSDVCPYVYGEDPVRGVGTLDYRRDAWELALCQAALRKQMPVFGICRGCQLLNAALGGSLYQDIPSQLPGAGAHSFTMGMDEAAHHINIEKNTRLAEILGRETMLVNSFHHQAVKEIASGLVVSARARDGVIEAIEASSRAAFVVGVQFHPEGMTRRFPHFTSLFAAHVAAAAAYKNARLTI